MGSREDYNNQSKPNWCSGCGHNGVKVAIQMACANLEIPPHELAIITGIGCSGRISGYIHGYGFHGTHGRALPIAQGVKIANDNLTVIAAGGDGDGYAIGMAHTVHGIRRNMDITYVVMDNHVYGLTKGQPSPRSPVHFLNNQHPQSQNERPINILEIAIGSGATFVAQGFSGDLAGLTEIIQSGIKHDGFSLINVLSPCVTYNEQNTFSWFKENCVKTSQIEEYDPYNRMKVLYHLEEHNGLLTGIIFEDNTLKSFAHPATEKVGKTLKDLSLSIKKDKFNQILEEFM